MASNRHLSRIIALQSIYEYDFRKSLKIDSLNADLDEILQRNIEVYKDAVDESDFITDLAKGTVQNQDKIDNIIIPAAPEWPLEQIAKMDKSILRMSLYEMLIKGDVPPKVVINEAVELAKEFGGDNSSKFINGVLGTIFRQSDLYDPKEDKRAQQQESQKGSEQKQESNKQ